MIVGGGPDIVGACVTDGVGNAVVVTSTGVGSAVVAVTDEGNVLLTTTGGGGGGGGGRVVMGVLSGTIAIITEHIISYLPPT